MSLRRYTLLTVAVPLLACVEVGSSRDACSWTQHARSGDHQNLSQCAPAQAPSRMLADILHDPFVEQELRDGSLRIHYQAPLVTGDDVYVQVKRGVYTPCVDELLGAFVPCGPEHFATQIWAEAHHRWMNGRLVEQWVYESDWKPVPYLGFEQMFHAAVFGDDLYVPGAGGTLHKVDRHSGQLKEILNPFGAALDPNAYVAAPPAISGDGTVYYSVIKLDPADPFFRDAEGLLVRVSRSGELRTVTYASLLPEAPAATDSCYSSFPNSVPRPLPPPPNPDGTPAMPPEVQCLSQRPAINSAPAIGSDGTVYVVSRAHRADAYAYLVAVDRDLERQWAASLRDRFSDGCGILSRCRDGALAGVDPFTNLPPAGRAIDSSTSSPVVTPDGVLYGAYTGYNGSRGHLMKFDLQGNYVAAYDFGWDVTPAVWPHDGTYSIIIKDNNYAADDFYMTQLNPDLEVEWRVQATNQEHCVRGSDDAVSCEVLDDRYEWCINAPAVDRDGTVHVASEDGRVYAIAQGGVIQGSFFLHRSLPSGYTPVVLDAEGRIYAMNNGHVTVVGK